MLVTKTWWRLYDYWRITILLISPGDYRHLVWNSWWWYPNEPPTPPTQLVYVSCLSLGSKSWIPRVSLFQGTRKGSFIGVFTLLLQSPFYRVDDFRDKETRGHPDLFQDSQRDTGHHVPYWFSFQTREQSSSVSPDIVLQGFVPRPTFHLPHVGSPRCRGPSCSWLPSRFFWTFHPLTGTVPLTWNLTW